MKENKRIYMNKQLFLASPHPHSQFFPSPSHCILFIYLFIWFIFFQESKVQAII